MYINSSATEFTLDVSLPIAIQPDITTTKGDKLKIFADTWHLEADCHFEREIVFPPHDIDITSIRAKFEVQGRLIVSAGRRGFKN
ncbi:hypothetical protein B0H13DRAFT_1601575 [Mycena leptocephala]|nr:hypothetical protein B0H13DRAFT_1601575 [Mycena leptocephala]